MNFRRKELAHFGDSIEWLTLSESQKCFDTAIRYSSNTHYGLNVGELQDVERQGDYSEDINTWLASRCDGELAYVVYSRDRVFRTNTQFFLANWRDIFCPGRDDAIILSIDRCWVAFYCHEDEFEIGNRHGPNVG